MKEKIGNLLIYTIVIIGPILLILIVSYGKGIVDRWATSDDPFQSIKSKEWVFDADVTTVAANPVETYPITARIHDEACAYRDNNDNCKNIVSVSRVNWPNGGYSTFDGCNLTGFNASMVICSATNGEHKNFGIVLKNHKH